ncbi:hypothetical protein MJO28_015575, partial [Puccinia striiformis f. sp. tritici]
PQKHPCQGGATTQTVQPVNSNPRGPWAAPRGSRSNHAAGQCSSNSEMFFFALSCCISKTWPDQTPSTNPKIAMEGHGGSDSWASMQDEYQRQTNPHPSDHSTHSSTSNSSLPQFHSGNGGTYNYHHGQQSFPGEQLHNSSPSYYQPNQPSTGHTMGSPAVDGNPPGVGGHTYSNSTPVGPLGHNGSGHTIGLQGDGNQPGGPLDYFCQQVGQCKPSIWLVSQQTVVHPL